ncbi:MAG: hypothetical protein A2X94_00920 [Bdellovibrionales bacterium GWB1_55_8]|nr:MAG: hypothetical protein A2X94_00920 [Bdellovibrionales bacterium GWB1_55_8]
MATTITGALEDYLETIFLLIRDKKIARVKDISQARGVRSASVSPALARLQELGMIRYVHREYVDLTAEGEKAALKIFSRHQLLVYLFEDVFNLPPKSAEADACGMEHSLSNEGLDHLERFVEFTKNDPEGKRLVDGFRRYLAEKSANAPRSGERTITQLKPGQSARVVEITGHGMIRQRLLDLGIMPNTMVMVERKAVTGGEVLIKLHGSQISLRRKEADAVIVLEDRN